MSTIDNFRNPEFVNAWSRWTSARYAWRNRYEKRMGGLIPKGVDPYNPDPTLLKEEDKPFAIEYLNARVEYLAILKKSNDDA